MTSVIVVPRQVVLLLTADTGGGHRAATDAVRQALDRQYPGRFAAVTCDPLTGPEAPPLVRRLCGRYGALVRRAPWLWAGIFHLTNAPAGHRLLQRLLVRVLTAPVTAALDRHRPAVIVALHPLLVAPAAVARTGRRIPLVTVITDLGTIHRAWRHRGADRVVASGAPVREKFRPGDRVAGGVRAALGIGPGRFVVLVMAGADGSRGLESWVRAVLTGPADADVIAVCGRNDRLRARLEALAGSTRRRLVVTGFVHNPADWMRSADVLVTRAGPGIIAEAAACGLPMLLAGHLPGQEAGNTELVVAAGAGRPVRGRRQLQAAVRELSATPAALRRMRRAAHRLARPQAGGAIADLLADTTTDADLEPERTPR